MDSSTAATELMNEQRGDRAEFEIGGVEVGALLRHRRLALRSMSVDFADRDAALVFDAHRFDDPHLAIGDRPIDVRQVPVASLLVWFHVNAGGRFLGDRKSTRLNSSHLVISYAVFCLKKKKN